MATSPIDILATLRQAPITGELDDPSLRRLAQASVVRRLQRGQVLFVEGEASQSFYMVCQGHLRVLRRSDEGNELVLSVSGPGDSIGELSVFDGAPRSATVEAIEPSVVLAIPHVHLRALLMASPASLMAVVASLADIVRRLTGSTSDLIFLDLPHRIARYLMTHAVAHDDGSAHVDLTMSQSGMAALLGVARQSYNTALNGLVHDDLIRIDGRRIEIDDLQALRDFLDT